MSTNHVALVVEDDDAAFEVLAEDLRALGHSYIRVTSAEEALPLLTTILFCYVLLDLQIKVERGSLKAKIGAGHRVLKEARLTHRGRTNRDKSLMQIIVMSGHTTSREDVRLYLQEGASAYLVKPFSDIELAKAIAESIRHSGRDDHDQCERITREARGLGAPADESASSRVSISLTGVETAKAERNEVLVGDRQGLVTTDSFVVLAHLVAAHERDPDEWVQKYELGLGTNDDRIYKAFSLLRTDLRPLLPRDFDLIDNNKRGRYQIHKQVATRADWNRLASHSNSAVQNLAKALTKRKR